MVNSLGIDEIHTMSGALKEVVLCSKEMVKLTRGAFDPCVAPLLHHYETMAGRPSSSAADSSNDGSSHDHVRNSSSHSLNGSKHDAHVQLSSITELPGNLGEDDGADQEVDIETIRRQRHVVDYWRSLLSAGFAGDPSDARISRTVRRLLEVGQWHSAFSVGGVNGNVMGDNNNEQQGRESRLGNGEGNSSEQYTIQKKHIDARMDLSGIAKGWAVDQIAESLPSPCWVEWGGDIKVRGKHPSSRPWIVAVPEPPKLSEIRMRVARAKKAGQKGPVYTLADEHIKDEDHNAGKGRMKEYLAVLELRDGEAVATSKYQLI